MRNIDPQVTSVIESLSRLLEKSLEIVESDHDSDTVVMSENEPTVRFGIRDTVGAPFDPAERNLLRQVLDMIIRDARARQELQSLDQRLRFLERENVDLSMKNRALAEISSRDSLTGLYTRWYMLDKIEAEMNRSLRSGSPMSLLMLDIDHFKVVNDSFGHAVGDQVLQSVGHVLKDSCRIYDIAGRYGGEEFCLMLPEIRVDNTMNVAERIRRRIEGTPLVCGGSTVRVTTSIGVAGLESVPEEGLFGASSLIERADRALYVAKDRGRNRIEVWSNAMPARAAGAEQ